MAYVLLKKIELSFLYHLVANCIVFENFNWRFDGRKLSLLATR